MHPCPRCLTLDAWRRWRTWLRATGSEDTARTYSGNVHRFLAETGPKAIADYTEEDCASFLEDVAKRGRSKYEYVKALRAFFRWCLRHRLIDADPMEFIQARKPRRKRPVVLTPGELVRMLIAAVCELGERVAWSILLIYSLGLRRKEAAGLKWEHIREGDTGLVIEIHETKGADERDPLPLSPLALECLAHLRELPVPEQALLGPEYILRIRRATVSDWVHRAGVAAGLHPRKIGSHRLRASMATGLLRRAGVDVGVVQKLLGHLRLESTAWYLEDASEGEMRAGLERLPLAG